MYMKRNIIQLDMKQIILLTILKVLFIPNPIITRKDKKILNIPNLKANGFHHEDYRLRRLPMMLRNQLNSIRMTQDGTYLPTEIFVYHHNVELGYLQALTLRYRNEPLLESQGEHI